MNPPLKQGACCYGYGSLIPPRNLVSRRADVRQHDDCPGTERDVPRRDPISQPSEATRLAEEAILSRAILPSDMPAIGALPARVAWVNRDNRPAGLPRLVLQERAELSECPVGVPRPLTLPHRYPVPDSAEVFDGDPTTGVLSGGDDTLRGQVPPAKAGGL